MAPTWLHYESKGGRFSIVLPRLPDESGPYDKETTSSVELMDADRMYSVAGTDLDVAVPSEALDSLYDEARDAAVANVNGTIGRERSIRCGLRRGREITIFSKERGAASRMRTFFDGAFSFRVAVTTRAGDEDSDTATAFLNSFRIRGGGKWYAAR